jgi:multicomponent Na+:H+ antiporter subunit G
MSVLSIVAYVLMFIGVAFSFLGSLGILRFPDVYNRLQAGTKCVTIGTCSTLLGAAIYGVHLYVTPLQASASFIIKPLLVIVLLLLTSPVGAHAIARAAYQSGVPMWEKSVVDQYKEYMEKGKEENEEEDAV